MTAKHKIRRILGYILGIFILLVVVAAALGPRLLPTEWVRTATAQLLSNSLSHALNEDVRVTIGAVHWHRWGHLRLLDLAVSRGPTARKTPGNDVQPFLTISEVDLRVRVQDLLFKRLVIKSLRVKQPSLSLESEEIAKLNLKPSHVQAPPQLAFAVETALVEKAQLSVFFPLSSTEGSKRILLVENLLLRLQGGVGQPLLYDVCCQFRTPKLSGTMRSSGRIGIVPPTTVDVAIMDFRLDTEPFTASGVGRLALAEASPVLDLRLVTRSQGEQLTKFLSEMDPRVTDSLGLSGVFASETEISGSTERLAVKGLLDLPQGGMKIGDFDVPIGALPKDIQYDLLVLKDQITINDFRCQGTAGKLSAKGRVTNLNGNPCVDVELTAPDIDAGQVFQAVCDGTKAHPEGWKIGGGINVGLALKAERGTFQVKGSMDLGGLDIVAFGGLQLKPAGLPWRAGFNVAADKDRILINEGTRFKGDVFTVDLSGRAALSEGEPILDVTAKSEMDAGQALKRWGRACLELPPGFSIAGRAHTVTRASGKPSDFEISWTNNDSEVAWSLDGKPLKEAGHPSGSTVSFGVKGSTLAIKQADFFSQYGKTSLSGQVTHLDSKPELSLTLSSQIVLKSVVELFERFGFQLSSDWKVSGRPRIVGVTVVGPSDDLKAKGAFDLGDVTVSWRGADLFWRRESPDFKWVLSCKKGRVSLDQVYFRSRGGEFALAPSLSSTDGSQGLTGHASLNVDEFKPIVTAAAAYVAAKVRESEFPATVKSLSEKLTEDLWITGAIQFPSISVQNVTGGLRFSGTTDMTPLAIGYRDIALKSSKDPMRSELDATVGQERLVLTKAALNSSTGVTELCGKLDLAQKEPTFELTLRTNADFQRLISLMPTEKVKADARLNKALKHVGLDFAELDEKFDIAGALSSETSLAGTPAGVSWRSSADLTELDLTYSAAFKKNVHQLFRLSLAGRATPKTFGLSSATIEMPQGRVALDGDITVAPGSVTGKDVKITLGEKVFATAFRVSNLRAGGFWLDYLRMKHGDISAGFDGPIMWEPSFIRADALKLFLNKDEINARFLAKDYYGEKPEIQVWARGAKLDLTQAFPGAKPPAPSATQPASNARPPALEPESPKPQSPPVELVNYMKRARIDVSILLGETTFDFCDTTDRNPGVRHYQMRDVSLEGLLEKGIFKGEVTLVLNGGMADSIINTDFNKPGAETRAEAWSASLGADDNLRPFLNMVFPNLYVDGTLSLSSRLKWNGLTMPADDPASSATTIIKINKGHVLGKPAPDYILKVFPNLNLYDYRFDECQIASQGVGPVTKSKMTFIAPTFCLYMDGETDSHTQKVDYNCGVDLVTSMGMEGGRAHIPGLLQRRAKIALVQYRGTLSDQHAEWFMPRLEGIQDSIRNLLPLKSLEVLASQNKTAGQKAEYFGKKVEHLLLLPLDTGQRITGLKKEEKPRVEQLQPPPTQRPPIPPEVQNSGPAPEGAQKGNRGRK